VPIERLGRQHVILGELAFEPDARRSHDLWVRSDAGYEIFYPADKRRVIVQLPPKARAGRPTWSPDGSQLAFFAHFQDATHIYVADAETGVSRKITPYPVVATMVTGFQWSKDGKRIETVLAPDDGRSQLPKADSVPHEPKVRVTRDGMNPSRTYRFLLDTPHDKALLEYLLTGQLALVSVADGSVTKVGLPAMYRTAAMSPGEDVYRVTTIKKPFSYFVPVSNFGSTESLVNREGKSLYTVLDRNLRQGDPQAAAPTPAVGVGGGRGGRGARGGRGRGAGANPNPADPNQPPPVVDPTQPAPPVDPGAPPRPFRPNADPDGKRELGWRPDGVGLSFLQLEPAKAGDDKAERNDRIMQWLPPFGKDDTKVVYSSPNRITGLLYSPDCKYAFVTQVIDNQRTILAVDLTDTKKTYVIAKGQNGGGAGPIVPATPGGLAPPPRPVGPGKKSGNEQAPQGRGGRGGRGGGRGGFTAGGGPTLLTKQGPGGAAIARMSPEGDVYLTRSGRGGGFGGGRGGAGGGRGRGGPAGGGGRLTIDKVNVLTGKTSKVFESQVATGETLIDVDGDEIKTVYTSRRVGAVSDAYMTDVATGKSTKLTENVDPAPWARKLKIERFTATRVDGVRINIKVTLPPDAKGKLPALFWIYPREYTDAASYQAQAGRAGGGANPAVAAINPRTMSMVTLLGYALVEPDVPIIGPAGRMNDNYVADLRNSLWAVIDELDKKGVIDRDRLACGGHSYGAFSTANALAHTPFFKAGIAGDGNYNRSLTPMTFQTERRNLWDARETYIEMSPLLWANQINGALLMYHGMDDQNVGTNPVNSENLFAALDGLGKPAALYMYPYENHGPVAKETLADMWARWAMWLDMYVKNPKPVKPPTSPTPPGGRTGNGD
jgi:dipeptidyl aminopeptidase/acylaminoacyl peptidase